MTFHFPDQVATNHLTVDAKDPLSGTSEFKAAAVRIEPVVQPIAAAEATETAPVSV
jgi:formate dehydrogenase major subunit